MQNNLEFNQKNIVPNCVIVDANAIVHSSFHAIEPKLIKKVKIKEYCMDYYLHY